MMSFQKNQVFLEQIQDFIALLTDNELRAFNSLLGYFNRYERVFVSQQCVASKIDCSRKLVNELFGLLSQFGLLKKQFRLWMTCLYELPAYFWDLSFRNAFKNTLTALNYFPAWKLLSKGGYIKNKPLNTEEFHFSWREFWQRYIHDEFKHLVQPNVTIYLTTKQQNTSLPAPPKHVSQEMHRSELLLFVKKKEEVVMNIVPDYIHDIKELSLTHTNKIQLSVYSKEVIDYARTFLAKQQHLSNPTAWFIAVCKKHNDMLLAGTAYKKPQQKEVVAPTEWQPQESYDRAAYMAKKHKMDEYIGRATKKPIDTQYRTHSNESIASSWNKPPEELARMKAEGLARVKDPQMKQYLSSLFDQSVLKYNTSVRATLGETESDILVKVPTIPIEPLAKPVKNTTMPFIDFDIDLDVDDTESDINTNLLFD